MFSGSRSKNGERGVTLWVGIASLVAVVPFVGLTIDVGMMYAVQTKLQASVDGAALAAARALVLGQSTTAQATSAKQNAVNWFYSNFPTSNWATSNTVMSSSNVSVFDDPTNPHLRNVTITATTNVPTYFMKWLNISSTTVSATGNASRRDVISMIVLDRSGSMNSGVPTACSQMISAAKVFTGQFSAGRDKIGLLSYSDGIYLHSAPSTSFQTTLGYTNSSGSAAGAIDTINCNGGTGTAAALSVAYNELYKLMQPGALNVVMLETDGLPNSMVLNWWDAGALKVGLDPGSPCKDKAGKTVGGGGFKTAASIPSWTAGHAMGPSGYMSDIPAGMIGNLYSSDPSQNGGSHYFIAMMGPWQASANTGNNSIYLDNSTAPSCNFTSSNDASDFNTGGWVPTTDVYGNQLIPGTNPYKTPVNLSGSYVSIAGNASTTAWTNIHNAALNATDNAAYRIRTNATLPAYMFVIGLGGNSGDQPDFTLLQRMANDPNGDNYNNPAKYNTCASTASCVNYSSQPQGTFIFSANSGSLGQAFLSISSQILRLSK